MTDLATIRIPVDSSDMVQAVRESKNLERAIEMLVQAFDSGAIGASQFSKGLLQVKREYQDLFTSSQQATAAVRGHAKSLQESKVAAEQAARAKEALAMATKKAETAFALANQRAREELQILRNRAEFAYAMAMQREREAQIEAQAMAQAQAGMNNVGVLMQQTGYQVGDFIVQVQSGTSAFVAFGQQATQLVGFLPLLAAELNMAKISFMGLSISMAGLTLGLSIIVPLITAVGALWMRTSESTKTAETSISDLESALSRLNETVNVYSAQGLESLKQKYGELNSEILKHIELNRQIDIRTAMEASKATIESLSTDLQGFFTDQYNGLRDLFGLTREEANLMFAAFEGAKQAASFEDQVIALTKIRDNILQATGGINNMTKEQLAFYTKVQQSLDAMLQLKKSSAEAGWLSSMIGEAKSLAEALWSGVRAKAAMAGPGMTTGGTDWLKGEMGFTLPGAELLPPEPTGTSGGGGGGGMSATQTTTLENKLEEVYRYLELDKYLMEQETIAYQQRQDVLRSALDQKLITLQEYNELEKAIATQHQQDLLNIEQQSQMDRLADVANFFGGLAAVTQNGGNKLVKATQTFAAVEALINTYRAQAQVLADPTLGFFGKAAAYLQIGAAGLNVVRAIKGAGGGGAGSVGSTNASRGSATVAPTTAAAPTPQTVFIDSIDPKSLYSGETLINLFEAFYNENDKRGKVFVVAR